jgi:hypothetical protein
VLTLELELSRDRQRRLLAALSAVNLVLAGTTATFIIAWARRDSYSPTVQQLIRHVLVQGHLATENVLAAWYSSMLLLVVGIGCMFACLADRRAARSWMRWGWLIVAAAFMALSLDEIGSLHERIGMIEFAATGGRALGWVWALALPIVVVGMFLLTFAAVHVRRSVPAFRWMGAGVVLFLLNPVAEAAEMSIIHGDNAGQGTWPRLVHDALLVIEEGGLELFGVLCFLMAVVGYLRTVGGDRAAWQLPPAAITGVRALTAALTLGVYAGMWLVARLPEGDTGIPSHWFPAAAWLLVCLTARSRAARAGALGASGYFGAGLYLYAGWLSQGFPHVAAAATILAGWTLEGTLRGAPSSPAVSVSAYRPGR